MNVDAIDAKKKEESTYKKLKDGFKTGVRDLVSNELHQFS